LALDGHAKHENQSVFRFVASVFFVFESVPAPSWNASGFIAAEADLHRMK